MWATYAILSKYGIRSATCSQINIKIMSAKTATIIGVTGLIGGYLYEALKQDKTYEAIRLIVRRPFVKDNDPTEVKFVNFNNAESFKLALNESDVESVGICTTQKKCK